MGKSNSTPTNVQNQASQRYQQTLQPSQNEQNLYRFGQGLTGNYNNAVTQNTADYGNIMGAYNDFRQNLSPTSFGYQGLSADQVSATRPGELNEAYGYLREAAPGYREFASTGGYSDADIANLRARGVDPIRASYGNAMMQLDRARALGGGNAGAPNYIAAAAQAQRELPQQMADATQNVNARLAEDVRQGRLAGLSGLTGIGGEMGGLSSAEAQRQLAAQEANQRANLEAGLANQRADIQTQQLSEESRQNVARNTLGALSGETGLYGTTPGMAATFGNQALNAYGQLGGMENARNQYGLGLLDAQTRAYAANKGQQGFNWGGLFGSMMPLLNKFTTKDPNQQQQQQQQQQNRGQQNQGQQQIDPNNQGDFNFDPNAGMDPWYGGYQYGPNGPGGGYTDFNPNDYGTTVPNPTFPEGGGGNSGDNWNYGDYGEFGDF